MRRLLRRDRARLRIDPHELGDDAVGRRDPRRRQGRLRDPRRSLAGVRSCRAADGAAPARRRTSRGGASPSSSGCVNNDPAARRPRWPRSSPGHSTTRRPGIESSPPPCIRRWKAPAASTPRACSATPTGRSPARARARGRRARGQRDRRRRRRDRPRSRAASFIASTTSSSRRPTEPAGRSRCGATRSSCGRTRATCAARGSGPLPDDARRGLQRVARAVGRRRVGVALGGGAAWGYAHVALVRALEDAGIPIDLVAG